MDSIPRPATVTNTRGHPPEFQQLIIEKSDNFACRQSIFAAISEFLYRCDRGYFTLIGPPGSGKSAILAKYVTENPLGVYYSAQIEGKNRAAQFLATICTQLMGRRESGVQMRWFRIMLLKGFSKRVGCRGGFDQEIRDPTDNTYKPTLTTKEGLGAGSRTGLGAGLVQLSVSYNIDRKTRPYKIFVNNRIHSLAG